MSVLFKHIHNSSDTECQVHFCVKRFIVSKEYYLTVRVEGNKAVGIIEGDVINADGWFDWDETAEESELLELVNEVYESKFFSHDSHHNKNPRHF